MSKLVPNPEYQTAEYEVVFKDKDDNVVRENLPKVRYSKRDEFVVPVPSHILVDE